jgi:hypothetical protein
MILEKDGVTYKLTDKTQIAAFLKNGWREQREGVPASPETTSKTPAKKKKNE